VGSGLAYLHDIASRHGAVAPDACTSRRRVGLWMLGWQWAVAGQRVPDGMRPDPVWMPGPIEWGEAWRPTPASDQWQLGAFCFAMLAGELPPRDRSAAGVSRASRLSIASIAQLVDRMLAEPDPPIGSRALRSC
jgi:hypothetical protein